MMVYGVVSGLLKYITEKKIYSCDENLSSLLKVYRGITEVGGRFTPRRKLAHAQLQPLVALPLFFPPLFTNLSNFFIKDNEISIISIVAQPKQHNSWQYSSRHPPPHIHSQSFHNHAHHLQHLHSHSSQKLQDLAVHSRN